MVRIRGVETLFEPIRTDEAFFRSLSVDEELGTIVWPNGADIDRTS